MQTIKKTARPLLAALAVFLGVLGVGSVVTAANLPYGGHYGFVEVGSAVSGAGVVGTNIDLNTFKLYDSTGVCQLGTAAASTHSLATGACISGGAFEIDGASYFDSTVTLGGQMSTAANLVTGGGATPLRLGTSAASTHSLSGGDVVVGGKLETDDTLFCDGAATLAGTNTLSGATTISGATTHSGTLTVNGTTTIANTVTTGSSLITGGGSTPLSLGTAGSTGFSLSGGDIVTAGKTEHQGAAYFTGTPASGLASVNIGSTDSDAGSVAKLLVKTSGTANVPEVYFEGGTGSSVSMEYRENGFMKLNGNGIQMNHIYADVAAVTNTNEIVGNTGSGGSITYGTTSVGLLLKSAASTTAVPAININAQVSGAGDLIYLQKGGTTYASMNTNGAWRYQNQATTKTTNYTILVTECGGTFYSATDGVTFTLPTAATAGCRIKIQNSGAAGAAGIAITRAGSDTIVGSYWKPGAANVATLTTLTATTTYTNTKATTLLGDYFWLESDGGTTWYIIGAMGIWA